MNDFLKNYQKRAWETASQPNRDQNLMYVALGLGEIGEICNKVKKINRDDNMVLTDEKRQALKKELGDVMWYIAGTCTVLGITLEAGQSFTAVDKQFAYVKDVFWELGLVSLTAGYHVGKIQLRAYELMQSAGRYDDFILTMPISLPYLSDTVQQLADDIPYLLKTVYILSKLLGFTLEDICDANLENLAGRKARGTLNGDGDNR